MRSAFRQAGVPVTIRQGEIYLVDDRFVQFPSMNPDSRTTHQFRYVLVMQGDEHAGNARCRTVLIAPLSSQTENKRSWEYELSANAGGNPADSLVKLQLVQAVPREALEQGQVQGQVDANTWEEIIAVFLVNLGVLPQP